MAAMAWHGMAGQGRPDQTVRADRYRLMNFGPVHLDTDHVHEADSLKQGFHARKRKKVNGGKNRLNSTNVTAMTSAVTRMTGLTFMLQTELWAT